MKQVQLLLGSRHAHIQKPHFLIVFLQVSGICYISLQAPMGNQGIFTTCTRKAIHFFVLICMSWYLVLACRGRV